MKITKEQFNRLVNQLVKEQFEWTEDEISSFGNDAEESEEWFSNFTGEDEDNTEPVSDQPWDDEYVGKADRAERSVQEAKKKKHKSPSEKVRKPVAPPSKKHKDPTKYDRKRDKKDVDLNEMRPMSQRGSMMQGKGEEVVKRFVEKHLIAIANSLGGRGGKWGRVNDEVKNNLKSVLRQVALEAYGHLDDVD
jgi:hypothetical protein